MLTRFGSNNVTRPITQLKRQKEEHSFVEVSEVDPPEEDHVVEIVEGLKNDNQKLLKVMVPETLQQANVVAKALTNKEDLYSSKEKGRELGNTSIKPNVWL